MREKKELRKFQEAVWNHYRTKGRHDLPWRQTAAPYKIIVSELMLQQTQVPRVIEKYRSFLRAFPTVQALAAAPLSLVLQEWSGLGYNRRAKYLHLLAKEVVTKHKGKFPQTLEGLRALPGIGPYTAGVVMAFVHNRPEPIIETNIRTVYLHHFFSGRTGITDKELSALIIETLDAQNPREWYWALMDYGSFLKQSGNKIHRTSAQYKKQSAFVGSRRQIRGAVIKVLLKGPATLSSLVKASVRSKDDVTSVLEGLVQEALIVKEDAYYRLAGN